MTGMENADRHARESAERAADQLRARCGVDRFDLAVVLGSGWSDVADALGEPLWEGAAADLPGFPTPTAVGHAGRVRLIRGRLRVLALLGRVHLYEGHPPATVGHAVRTAVAAGCRTVLLTNAAGGIRPDLAVGQPVLIRDQLNLTGRSPLAGARFTDLTGLYDPELRALARTVDPGLAEGVYAGLVGPQFETPAEIGMLARLGADLVGMSTVVEAIAARAAGARLLGVSLVSNLAAGISPVPLSAEDVLAAGRAALPRLGALLAGVVDRLAATPER
ncbi:MAG TPA: purine-nucleoside phosphorylase [Mycobacteriales bacterium]|nr:purine-nucleoside phosphorylase [Mycobacteriales bacterium]